MCMVAASREMKFLSNMLLSNSKGLNSNLYFLLALWFFESKLT